MKKKLWLLFNLSISAFFVWLAVRGVNWQEVGETFSQVNYFWVITSVLMNIFSCWLRAIRWKYLMKPVAPIPLYRLFTVMMMSFMVNNLLPFRLGELMRAIPLKRNEGVSFSATMGTVVIERVIDVITLLMVFGICLLLFSFPVWIKSGSLLILGIILLVMLLWYYMVHHKESAMNLFDKFTRRLPASRGKRLNEMMSSFITGMSMIQSLRSYIMILFYSMITWFTYMLSFYLMFQALNLSAINGLNLIHATVSMVFASFAIMIPAAPGYVGTFHEMTKQSLILFGVDREPALTFAIIIHGYNYIAFTGIGLYYFIRNNLNFREALQPLPHEENA